jgi:antigen flippase
MEQNNGTSYKQIAKSTSIFGGSQFMVIVLGIVRTKVLAVLLGTAGVGLVGMFQSIIDLVRSLSGLGLSFSSVKDIAEANNTNDRQRIAQTITVLHRWLWWTGILGMLLMILFSAQLSEYIFGDRSKIWPICLLSFCVLTGTISSGQIALLQGMRQILIMAKASLFGALGGSVVAIILYSIWGINGVVPALIAMVVCPWGEDRKGCNDCPGSV